MRIDPALPPPAATQLPPPAATQLPLPAAKQLPLPAGAEPGRPFEDFVDGGIGPGRAFGFTELGMFGREEQPHGPAPAPASPPGKPPLEACTAVMPMVSLDEPADRPAAPSPAPAASAAEPGQRPTRVLLTPEGRPHAPLVRTGPAESSLASPAPRSIPADEDVPSSPPTARPIVRAQPPRADVSLLISEKDGGVALVAAGPALDPESCALLRRLARAILARSGLALVQFHLNGVALAPASMTMIGGSHGTRTR
jgi:hypothetical protein